jgi:allantoin racemase
MRLEMAQLHTRSVHNALNAKAQPRLLLVNGNASADITRKLSLAAEALLGGRASIVLVTPDFGPAYIRTRAEATIAGHAILSAVAKAVRATPEAAFQACILACFGEPALFAAREVFDFPVVGMVEASVVTALQLGSRVAIITGGERWPTMIRELLRGYGLDTRCVGVLQASLGGADPLEGVEAAVGDAVERLKADVVIVGGATLAGAAERLQPRVPVPLVDSFAAAVLQAEALARLGAPKARRGAFAALPAGPIAGIDADLASFFEAT